jgi:hypothetical protein
MNEWKELAMVSQLGLPNRNKDVDAVGIFVGRNIKINTCIK